MRIFLRLGSTARRAAGALRLNRAVGRVQVAGLVGLSASASRAAVAATVGGSLYGHYEEHQGLHAAHASRASEMETLSDAFGRVDAVRRRVVRGVRDRWQSDEGRVVLSLIAVNACVYALWKVAPTSFMVRNFTSSLEAMRRGRTWTVLTANFSHMGALHLVSNMYLLNEFSGDVVRVLTPERFLVLYMAGGLASVLASLTFRRMTRSNVLSLGASGSVMAVMFMFANLFPDREIWFLWWKVKARDALVAWALFDAAGLLGSFGKIDFAAHLGGAAFSFMFYEFTREELAKEYAAARSRNGWFGGSGREPARRDSGGAGIFGPDSELGRRLARWFRGRPPSED